MPRTLVASAAVASVLLIGLARDITPSDIKREIVARSGLDPELIHEAESEVGETMLIFEDEDFDLVSEEIEEVLNDLESHREVRGHKWC